MKSKISFKILSNFTFLVEIDVLFCSLLLISLSCKYCFLVEELWILELLVLVLVEQMLDAVLILL